MMGRDGTSACPHGGSGRPINELCYSFEEETVLYIARCYFHTLAAPDGQNWIRGISRALASCGHERGPHVAVAVLSVVQTMRRARRSTFHFNSADCPLCSRFVTAHEQSLMAGLRSAARGQLDAASAHVTLLCEGNDACAVVRALDTLAYRALQNTERGKDASPRETFPADSDRSQTLGF